MKKYYLQLSGLLLFSLIILISCQKDIKVTEVNDPSGEGAPSRNTANRSNLDNTCRLLAYDWSAGGSGIWQFHYNEKGLADQWTIDYGYGTIEETMHYDASDRLVSADEIYFGSNYVYQLYYSDKLLTRLTRTSLDIPDDVLDFQYSYNSKGENIRQDDDNSDTHVVMDYDEMGNCTRTDIYFGSDLYYSDNYTFEEPIRNPLLNVPGIEIGFLSYGGTYVSNKRWFTTNRTLIYDNGVPFLINDYDPSRTNPVTGNHNFPSTLNYFDRVSGASLDILFDYDNCEGQSGQQNRSLHANRNRHANRSNQQIHPALFLGSLKSIKEQIEQRKMGH